MQELTILFECVDQIVRSRQRLCPEIRESMTESWQRVEGGPEEVVRVADRLTVILKDRHSSFKARKTKFEAEIKNSLKRQIEFYVR